MQLSKTIAKQPPVFDGSDACSDLLDRLYPKAEKSPPIELDIVDLIENYLDKKELIKGLQDQQNEIVNNIKGMMGNNENAKSGEYFVKWENRTRVGIDSKILIELYPDVFESCQKQSNYRIFTIK